jgi:hypothetical protein
MKALIATLAACLTAFASPAQACMSQDQHRAYIHAALPNPLPSGAFVAEVEFEPLPGAEEYRERMFRGLRARVLRVVQGAYRGREVIARPTRMSSCDSIFGNGRRGLIVAIPRGAESGVLVIDPISAWSGDGYRLPNGYEIGPERIAIARLADAAAETSPRTPGFALLALGLGLTGAIALILFWRTRRPKSAR